jgi:hypothetical protein
MLRIPAPFPEVGSYALLIDTNLPAVQQRAELVRVMRRDPAHGQAAVAFPLRVGAFGNRVVGESELIDATPLTKDEERELADLQRHLAGRDRLRGKLVAAAVRCEKLRQRAVWQMILESELARLRSLEARQQPSFGRPLPREAA